MKPQCAMKYSCGSPSVEHGHLLTFHDLLADRDNRALNKPGLSKAVEAVRFMALSKALAASLVIENDADLPSGNPDRLAVCLLLDAADASLIVAGTPTTPEDCVDALGWRNSEDILTALETFGKADPWITGDAQECSYLCNHLGLTGSQAATFLNFKHATTRYATQQVHYHAKKREANLLDNVVKNRLASPDSLLRPIDVDLLGQREGRYFFALSQAVTGELPNKAMLGALRRYKTPDFKPIQLPQEWANVGVKTTLQRKIDDTLPFILQVAQFRSPKQSFRTRARKFASDLRKNGKTFEQIAQELNDQGYPVTRGGRWHRQSVSVLLTSNSKRRVA